MIRSVRHEVRLSTSGRLGATVHARARPNGAYRRATRALDAWDLPEGLRWSALVRDFLSPSFREAPTP